LQFSIFPGDDDGRPWARPGKKTLGGGRGRRHEAAKRPFLQLLAPQRLAIQDGYADFGP